MISILHDLTYQNPRNSGSIVFIRCRFFGMNSMKVVLKSRRPPVEGSAWSRAHCRAHEVQGSMLLALCHGALGPWELPRTSDRASLGTIQL